MRDTMKLDEVQLTNVADGALEREFQTLLCEVNQIIANGDEYQTTKEGELKMKVELSIDLIWMNGSMTVVTAANLKRPKRIAAARGLYRRGNAWFVWDEGAQMGLAMPTRTAETMDAAGATPGTEGE